MVALTSDERDWLVKHGAAVNRIHIIGLGPLSDPHASPALARKVLESADRIVLFLGQLYEYKGFRAVIDAARHMKSRRDVRFVFAGPDVRGNAKIFATAPPNVTYLSAVDDGLRDSLLKACTVLCVPSSRESFGAVVVEAWACRKPVIGGPAAATRELVDEGLNGWTVPQDGRAIARRLEQLLDDEDMCARIGYRGWQKVQTSYSWQGIAEAHLDLYAGLTAAGPPA